MKMRDDTHSGQKMLMKPQDLETVTSMMYDMSLQQGKTKKPFKPQVYQKRGRGQRKVMIEIDPNITIGKDKALGKTGIEMIIEGMGICKISVELMAEIEIGEISTEAIVVTGVGQEKEAYPPGGTTIKIGKMEVLDLDQGLGVDLTQEQQQIGTGLDCYKC